MTGTTSTRIRRAWADTPLGALHYAESGEGFPVLLLHQTPRSWREYAAVIPLLAAEFRVIALDSVGFGDSERPDGPPLTIELLAGGAIALLDALGVDRCHLVGHHTGGIVGVELLASSPDRFARAVLSATPLIDAAWRERVGSGARIDVVTPRIDGGHLLDLWRGRQPFYPADRVDLLEDFVVDALRARWDPADGHIAVQSYRMEDRIGLLRTPLLLLAPEEDPFVVADVPVLARAVGAQVSGIPGGMIPLPDQLPEVFAAAVLDHLRAG